MHASEREALILGAENPLDATHMVLIVAGNAVLSTVKAVDVDLSADEYIVFQTDGDAMRGFRTQPAQNARLDMQSPQ